MSEINADHYSNYRTACTTTFMHKHCHNRFLLVIFSFSDHYFLFGILYSRPIRLENFAEHYRMMSADSDFRFSEEFEELKHVGREQPCSAADLPCNRPKNRFTNILPYDHSRFKLQPVDDEEGSDYINANYVPVSTHNNVNCDKAVQHKLSLCMIFILYFLFVLHQNLKGDIFCCSWWVFAPSDKWELVMITNMTPRGSLKCHKSQFFINMKE